MRIDFKPQRLLQTLALEEKMGNTVRRLIKTEGRKPKTIDMELTNLDSLGNVYPKGYYVSSFKVYDEKGKLSKMMNRTVSDTSNSETYIIKKRHDDKYEKGMIIRNNTTVSNDFANRRNQYK